ncbi:hypothetical protein DI272_27895 [Streptomyces sp. Act143]|uniref:hypothetical protein n=1 Tax=Streptomyces sp. Act143 TaxID=2200760 RepID=UPI000D6803EE|nr:hypothetical protein [Streptomyces sp. Act143]PWI17561.1 hypothetical protein DI272_27895 [Streptomyces sp. Act143]
MLTPIAATDPADLIDLPDPADPTSPTHSTDLGVPTYTTGRATFTVRSAHDDNVHATCLGSQAHAYDHHTNHHSDSGGDNDDNVHITYARSSHAHATASIRRRKALV